MTRKLKSAKLADLSVSAGKSTQARRKIEKRWDSVGRVAVARRAPVNITGANAKYDWLRKVSMSDLAPVSRLVAHTLCLHGRQDGTSIFPSAKVIAMESGLSERSVCSHLDELVLHGYLWRALKNTGRDWASTTYTLCVPKTVLDSTEAPTAPWESDPTWRPEPGINGAEPPSVPQRSNDDQAAERRSVPQNTQSSPDALNVKHEALNVVREALNITQRGTEPGAREALKDVQHSLRSSESSDLVSHVVSHVSVREPRTGARENAFETKAESKTKTEAKAVTETEPQLSPRIVAMIAAAAPGELAGELAKRLSTNDCKVTAKHVEAIRDRTARLRGNA